MNTTWYGFARAIFEELGADPAWVPATTDRFPDLHHGRHTPSSAPRRLEPRRPPGYASLAHTLGQAFDALRES